DVPLELYYATVENNETVKIAWQPGLQKNIGKYIIDRSTNAGAWEENFAETPNTSFIDNDVKVNNDYYAYRVRTSDECGNESEPGNTAQSVLLRSSIDNDYVNLSWNVYEQWAAGVNRYVIQVRKRDRQFVTVGTVPGTATTFRDDSVYLYIDTAYCYRLIAYENGDSPDSSVSNVTCSVLDPRIWAPNAFTPNGDTLNDTWHITALSVYNTLGTDILSFQLQIFDRWGNLVFTSDDLFKGWDGTHNGKPVLPDVYIYSFGAKGVDSRFIYRNGTITVLK
ncbi:MAG: gliding motility-associated C-terminal domain-containing protein, partial [Bacteroidota bacterium]|nr:gliding motility-associated C-terminal domain-containing protein [Bacteroidota bacterium]